jgi:hypothetical protein
VSEASSSPFCPLNHRSLDRQACSPQTSGAVCAESSSPRYVIKAPPNDFCLVAEPKPGSLDLSPEPLDEARVGLTGSRCILQLHLIVQFILQLIEGGLAERLKWQRACLARVSP